jgi:hypothetical protein
MVCEGIEQVSFPDNSGRVPHVRTSVHGPKMGCSNAFTPCATMLPRMNVASTTKPDRKSGVRGAPAVHAQEAYGTVEAVPFVEANCT